MKVEKWTIGLAAAGLVSLPSGVQSEEKASAVMTALSSTTISGYVSASAQWNMGSGNAGVPTYSYGGTSKADGFNLDVVKLSIERPLDEGQWSAGYKADLLFGPDASSFATTSALGGDSSDFAIKQAYVALRAPVGNGLDFKLGVWDTIIGYETFDNGNNPNYTRSYGFTIEPTTHTGLLATYQLNEMFGIAAGIANTFGPTINQKANDPTQPVGDTGKAESYKTYMGSIAFTAPESFGFMQGSTLYFGIINGFDSTVGDDR
ncbi:MAG: porin, partial [Verrucomicrobia subdivision 3 bacterium]|nr:porin [Limisphaerales bacterium]